MKRRRRLQRHWRWLAALLCLGELAAVGCGLQPVELLPGEADRSAGDRDLVIGDVPASALTRLQSAANEMGDEGLALLYPAPPELVLPADLAPIEFVWQRGKTLKPDPMTKPAPMPTADTAEAPMPMSMAGAPAPATAKPMDGAKADKPMGKAHDADPLLAYELRVHGDGADVRLYVAALSAAFPRDVWRALLRQHVGDTLHVELRAVSEGGAFVHAPALELQVRAALRAGSFYSFSTTAQGVTRSDLSRTHETLLVPGAALEAAPSSGCVGCHAISRDGRRMLAAGGGSASLRSWDLASGVAELRLDAPEADGHAYVFGSFDQNAARIARTLAGRLTIYNADTGDLLAQSPAPLRAAIDAPDWSPDGRSIAVVLQRDPPEPDARGGDTLATIGIALDGGLSEPRPLVGAGKDEHLLSPCYSPDGAFIIYERRKGPTRDPKDSTLFIVPASGGDPIELRALRDKPMTGASSPSFVPGDVPDHAYVVFSSRRAVGDFMPAEGQRQLFAAALDLSLAAQGEDPSHAPFWLPFQQRSSSYLHAQWAPALTACTPSPEVCDEADDDCDGDVDEDCCSPVAERCDNQSDDDCDGAIDEGCGCEFRELCDNGKDDDCDLSTDEQPCAPTSPR